ncbi:MAG: acyl-CoA dehydratase activase, partial [Ignavibacteriaceae bacterium]|nr:acyl-CoA dehydratase activase [Ignavibacteriaceae bacterium]
KHLEDHIETLIIPETAKYFEALGAALFALENDTQKVDLAKLYKEEESAFTFHDDLKLHLDKVQFKSFVSGKAEAGDVCILGLDVGSTTTKGVLMRKDDNSVLASEYLRTNGDPIVASVQCYKSIKNKVDVPVQIVGLGVTGSGRHISGLHAQTKGVINEIIAHANATVYFDPEVDTIFEIGGQDAKYTYITAGIPSDYAMNEACSAGTGSFLEEAAKESLNMDYKEIGEIALKASRPPNFNDQCAAFISSDIKNALHEGLSGEDIVAGLVYSICLNYTNRVKGNRPVGKKVFMQGGVCYNKAVPIAMAALTGKEIIVPPEPGLMGAFGVALEIKKKLELGLMEQKEFVLDDLINRTVKYEKSFVCAGGAEKCDRKCSVSLISVNGKKYPFGGACNKYYNLQIERVQNVKENNLVNLRQELVFEKYIHPVELDKNAKVIGIPKSFLVNTIYPLYYNFFTQLGFKVELGDEVIEEGVEKRQSAFCYPVELAHGFMQSMLNKHPDYIFLPHIIEMYNPSSEFYDRTCVFLQAENYYLKSTFKKELEGIELLSPIFNFAEGYEAGKDVFIQLALNLGCSKAEASASFDYAVSELNDMLAEFKAVGKAAIEEVESDPNKFAMVLFGRSYNAFAGEANLGIPQKFASRDVLIIPHDFLSAEEYESSKHMYWGTGRQILRNARFVKQHEQLFGAFITNFSCGPDSFIINFFREIMGHKPSLTLELDSHSADAGINTRVEAAIDIIRSYRELLKNGQVSTPVKHFVPLKFVGEKIIDSDGIQMDLRDKRIKMLIPNMGNFAADAFAAAFRYIGINAYPINMYNFDTIKEGRGNSTCKECLPLILNAGSLIEYCKQRDDPEERTILFLATSTGPCRLGQYSVFLENMINKKELHNVGIYTLTDDDSYSGMGDEFVKRGWAAITCSDVIQNISLALRAIAVDKKSALEILHKEWQAIIKIIEKESLELLYKQLELSAAVLKNIPTVCSFEAAPKVALVGEIFVRHDEFSRKDLIERLAERNIIVSVAPIGEYVYYSNYIVKKQFEGKLKAAERLAWHLRDMAQRSIEKNIKQRLVKSGLAAYELIEVDEMIDHAEHLIRTDLAGEAILTVGSALYEILDHASGVISLGPFGCMPSRVAEAILNVEMNMDGKLEAADFKKKYDIEFENLPFLAIETDGNIFPQIIQSKIEIFSLQAERLHQMLMSKSLTKKKKIHTALAQKLRGYYLKQNKSIAGEQVSDLGEIASETEI